MDTYLKGTFKKCIFSSNEGFYVGLVKIKDTNDQDLIEYVGKQFTFTGLFANLNIDEDYIFYGEVVDNKKYGIQYSVNKYEKNTPEDKDGLIVFLSSDIFPGVGTRTAESIVNTLGEDCLKKIIDDYTSLLSVPKITDKKAIDIYSRLVKYNESYDVVVYLTNVGFNMKDALKIYNHYLEDTIRVVENNPYELIDTIDSISFSKIDLLKNKFNIEDDDERRIFALIIYSIKEACFQSGDTFLDIQTVINALKVIGGIELSSEKINFYLVQLNSMGKIIIKNGKVILSSYYKDELYISTSVFDLTNKEDSVIEEIDSKICLLENYFSIEYNDEQKRAIKQALTKNFSIITGGPGTGKTTIIKGITQLYKMVKGYSKDTLFEKMVLLAPTGRAAKRMSETCIYPAYTIHRYLRWNKDTNDFFYNERNKVKAEFIIVDEVSMIDTELMANFFKALPQNTKLVFIGDYNQLESVGPGKVLKDFIESDVINTIFLKQIYRQDQNSFITELAYQVNNGDLQEEFLLKKDDYNFIKCDNSSVLEACCRVCKMAYDKGYDLKNIQILAPMYKGVNGIDNLNKILQKIFNPSSSSKAETYDLDVIYREGDKILQLENMPDDNVFNGDIGFIEKIDNGEITVNYDGNKVKYTKKDYKAIKHGYAISVHKAQGSEFEIVIMPVINDYRIMLYRKLIYTGITRAKKSLILVGDPVAFNKAVYNKGNKERNTFLKELIIDNITL